SAVALGAARWRGRVAIVVVLPVDVREALLAAQLVPVRREHALRFRAAGRSREPVRSPVDVLESRRHADLWPDGAQRLGLLAREGTRRDSSIGAPRLRVPTVFVPVD